MMTARPKRMKEDFNHQFKEQEMFLQGSGEEATFSADQLTAMLAHGKKGVDELVQLQKAAIDAA